MDILELKELKAEYERELLLAEAKVTVINDIIAKAEAKPMEVESEVAEETELETPELTTY
jgi:hypothetical protein